MSRYLIKIHDKVNNSERIIMKQTTLESYNDDYKLIYDQLNINNDLSCTFTNSTAIASIFKYETIITKGYIYNSKKIINNILYELSLIKIDELSSIFINTTQIQTESDHESEPEIAPEIVPEIEPVFQSTFDSVIEDFAYEFSKCDLNTYYTNPFDYIYKTQSDIILSPVLSESTIKQNTTPSIFSPELINELKLKLKLPNAGLSSTW